MKKRLIYDATQLAHWAGGLTGIPRVMHELGTRFANDQELDVIFVSWVKSKQSYYEIDFEQTMKFRGKKIVYISRKKSQSPQKHKYVANISMKYKKVARKLLNRATRLFPGLVKDIENKASTAIFNNYKIAELTNDDIIVITWGEWWDQTFIDYLKRNQYHGTKIVQLIHDIGPLTQPQYSSNSTESLENYCRSILPICEVIITISKNTHKDIVSWRRQNKIAERPIKIFREGDDFNFTDAKIVRDQKFVNSRLKGKDYILTVGTVEAKKNHQLLYYVYKLAAYRGLDLPKVVIVGRRGWKTDDMYDIATTDPETKDKMVFLHNVNDGELSWLYDNCIFTIFMSFYEGWGMPIAESVARGVPCICSNTSSMVEIAEGHVGHFNPSSTDECLKEMLKLLEPTNLDAAIKKAKSYKQLSWDESYEQFKKIVQEKQ
jgi:glycosyltransferase involved in cell wall biosynthesis